jgi:hypothetical protein
LGPGIWDFAWDLGFGTSLGTWDLGVVGIWSLELGI